MSKGQNVQLKLVNGSFSPSESFRRDALVNGFASSLNHGWEEFQTSRWMIEIRIHTCKSFFFLPQYATDCSYFRRRKTVIPIRYTILQNNTKLSLFFSPYFWWDWFSNLPIISLTRQKLLKTISVCFYWRIVWTV